VIFFFGIIFAQKKDPEESLTAQNDEVPDISYPV